MLTTINTNTQEIKRNFLDSLKSPVTKNIYSKHIRHFMLYVNVKTYQDLMKIASDIDSLESKIIDFIVYCKDTRKLAPATVSAYFQPVKHFYIMNLSTPLNWDRIYRFLGEYYSVVEDKPYTKEQIQVLLERAELRNKIIILLMASAGLRVGSLSSLRIKDLTPISKYGIYQITVYKNSRSKYTTFCTQECRKYIDQYLDYRKRAGETLTPDSPLLRKHADVRDKFRINRVEPLNTSTLRWILYDLLSRKTGMRITKDSDDKSLRHDVMMCHGLRKFFDTTVTTISGMHPLYSEKIMGHSLGLKHRYTKITDTELLEGNDKMIGYVGAINDLTINETYILQKKVSELEEYKRRQKEMIRDILLKGAYQIKNKEMSKKIRELGENL